MLHSAFGDNDADNTVTLIASQINYGKEFFEEDKELILEFSKALLDFSWADCLAFRANSIGYKQLSSRF